MKKVLLFFIALLTGVSGVWGQFVPDADTEYTLACCGSHEGGTDFIGLNDGNLNGQCATGARLKFESTTGGYYIKVVDVNKYFNWNSGAVLGDAASTVWEFRASFIANKVALAPVGTASSQALNNNEEGTHLRMGPFANSGNTCSHWTIRGIKTPSGYNRYIGGITTGSSAVDATKWKTQTNWSIVDNTWSTGPGYSGSNMWSPIYLQDVTATGIAFEGWNLRLKLVNSSLTATTVKLQTNMASTIDVDETSTLNLTLSSTNNNGWTRTFNIDGNLTIGMGEYNWATASSTNTINLGTTGQFTLAANSAKTVPEASSFTINATLTDPTENNTVESRTLATFTNVTVTTLSHSITGTAGWTLVDNKAALETQSTNGKYYFVEKGSSSGVKLHTYQRSVYDVPASAAVTLSEIADYGTYKFNVPSGSTLIIDVDDFDLTKITGAGNVTLDANATISGSKSTVATGKLTINEGKTLTIGGGDSETNSIASFTSIDLAGTIKHQNSKATLNNVTVPTGKTGKIFAFDMGEDADGFKLAGTTTLNGNLTVCSKWNFQMKVDELAGSGTWLICGTTGGTFDAAATSSNQNAVINVGSSPDFTGTIHGNNSKATVNIKGTLANCTFKANYGTPALADGAVLDGVILDGTIRISTSGTVTIKDLAGNNLSGTSHNYAFVGSGTINFEGTCDLTKKSDGTASDCAKIGYPSGNNIVIKSGANVTASKVFNTDGNNAAITNNGSISAEQLYGLVTLGESSTTTLSDATPFNGDITVVGDATLNLTASPATLSQTITIAEGKTLTINGNVNLGNATIEGGATRDFSTLPNVNYDNCTLIVTETTAEFNTDDEVINIINIPSSFTTVTLRRADRRYVILDVTNGSATFTDSEAKVSGPKCLYDFTFSLETLAERKAENSGTILNSGSRGSSNGLTYDTGYSSSNSYNETTGLLKVKSTPWRDMTGDNAWPTNYSVAVYANVPDVENGCLMAFGSSVNGGNKYLALIRGASSNEIKLVKGNGQNNPFEVIATMSAENATVAKHLVVFTKSGSTFKVYCDGVNVATTTYNQTLGTGFQIGSIHGGVPGTGIIRINDNSVSSEVKDAVEVQSIRIFDGVLNDDQMSALMAEFPYVSNGGSYRRTITTDANLREDNAWIKSDETTHHIPTSVIDNGATYYPDVTITASADATLTVNEDATFGKTSFGGSGTLTIAKDANGHSINVVGAVIVNSDVIVKFGAIDMSTSPVTKGGDATLTFDFSGYDFSDVYDETTFVVTGNTSDYGNKVIGVYPSDIIYHTYTLTHDGSSNRYVLTVTPTVALKQQQAIDLVQSYYDGNYVGAGLGKYTISLGATSYATLSDFETAVGGWASLGDYVEPTITINQPTSAFYRIKSGSKYLQDVRKSNEATQRTLTDASGANESAETIFYLNNNTFVGYKTGYGFGNSVCMTKDTEHLNSQLFTESAEMGKYTIQSQKGTYSSDTDNVGYWGIDGDDLSSENDAADGACWTIEEVTTLPVTITPAKYATLYSPVALTIPSGVTAYVISEKKGTSVLHLEEVTGIIPASQGVILYANVTNETTYEFSITTESSEVTSLLTGTYATATRPANSFVLGNGSNGIGFYGDGPSTVAGFKAYYQGTSEDGASVKAYTFDFETAVKAIEAAQNPSKTIYDLNGRRVLNPEKGLYIVNGKKVVIK